MNKSSSTKSSGSYTANLLGNIRSHLAGLQGYDVMAMELIQNADDAKADKIIFNITDEYLLVSNNSEFSYCGNLNTSTCSFYEKDHYSCDYHRIVDVGSGGKLSKSENIGRFGIGFVSTYQITDHPQIQSSGIKLVLFPEKGQWDLESSDEISGTCFTLPWASNEKSESRLALGVSHITNLHVEQLVKDIETVLQNSLLFLRNLKYAEIQRNGVLILSCHLERTVNNLTVILTPSGRAERWTILHTDAKPLSDALFDTHPRLKVLNRDTKISIGLRLTPEPLEHGNLYAFLPTEQSTGLPLHINADFFPEPDRKAIIFKGYQHEQAWNEMLIKASAEKLASDLEGLTESIGYTHLWKTLSKAFELSNSDLYPKCFDAFWDHLKETAINSKIVLTQDTSIQRPDGVFLPRLTMNSEQIRVFQQIGGRLVAEELRPFNTVMTQLGSPILTFERMVDLLAAATEDIESGETQVSNKILIEYYEPLWSIVNALMPESAQYNVIVKALLDIPFILTEDLYAVTINQTYLCPSTINPKEVVSILPRLAIASSSLLKYPKISQLINKLNIAEITNHIKKSISDEPLDEYLETSKNSLRTFYSILAELSKYEKDSIDYKSLRNLPIWASNNGLISASNALLPGNFTDPTGQANLLNTNIFTESAKEFIRTKLGIKTQTIETFVQTVLPDLFDDNGPVDKSNYYFLIIELANHPTLVNDECIRNLLSSLPIMPTQDGKWNLPKNIYRSTDELTKILGNAKHLWLDINRIPNTVAVNNFINSLGLKQKPNSKDLVDRMIYLSDNYLPNEDVKRSSSDAFYILCEIFDEFKDDELFSNNINMLRDSTCFPAMDDENNWFCASDLYAPYRAEGFSSQANILDFRNTLRLNRDFIEDLGVKINPETSLVIDHLNYCIEENLKPHITVYQILNEKAKADSLVSTLSGSRCIYVESQKTFVRTNQIYWAPPNLGKYAFSIPSEYESFKSLYDSIGVKNSPEAADYVDILLDIIGVYYEKGEPIISNDKAVYDVCLQKISSAYEAEELKSSDIEKLKTSPCIINLSNYTIYPDEILVQDSEWHADFFDGELNSALCKPIPEYLALYKAIGVNNLSNVAEVSLDYFDGTEVVETDFFKILADKTEIISRLLHDKPALVRNKIANALSNIEIISYDIIRIQALVKLGDNTISAPPVPSLAFFNKHKNQVILARPVNDRSWPHLLKSIFHQLIPEVPASDISLLTLSLRPLIHMSTEAAHRELNDAGIPFFIEDTTNELNNLTSPELDEITNTDISHNNNEEGQKENADEHEGEKNFDNSNNKYKPSTDSQTETKKNKTTPKKRPKHKSQWDRRLLSYVRKETDDKESSGSSNNSEHNLKIEAIARNEVCNYEKEHGRIPEQMAQTHPGYDIISHDPITGEERFIEVKGVSGEWKLRGVGLSKLQFSNAQDFGDSYWLYVVEFVNDIEHIDVHPIQSPAQKVTSFMFDGNWRDVAIKEEENPALEFVPGIRIKTNMGEGVIISINQRGNTRLMTVQFDDKNQPTPNVALNLYTMKILEEDNGEDAS